MNKFSTWIETICAGAEIPVGASCSLSPSIIDHHFIFYGAAVVQPGNKLFRFPIPSLNDLLFF